MYGQTSSEFLAVLPFVFILFVLFIGLYFNQLVVLRDINDRLDAQAFAYRLAYAINQVYLAGDGANLTLDHHSPYEVRLRTGIVEVRGSQGRIYEYPILTGDLHPGHMTLDADPLVIVHDGDDIELQN